MRRTIPRIAHSIPIRILPTPARPQCILQKRTLTNTPKAFEEELPFQEKLRRKLWGTDNPPGNPYGKPEEEEVKEEEVKEEEVKKEEKAEVDRTGYSKALNGKGLRVVGGVVSATCKVDSFLPETALQTTESIHRAVHRAVVEVFTATLNGLHPTSAAETLYTGPEDNTPRVTVTVSEYGEALFEYESSEVETAILRSTEKGAYEEDQIRDYTEEEVYPAEREKPAWLSEGLEGKGWAALRLAGEKEEIKFAVIKRVMQLTGIRIPDPAITQMKTVQHLLEHLQFKPAPKKLIDTLVNTDLQELPNVKLIAQKVRPLDKERAIGRARPIEKEIEYLYPFFEKPVTAN